MQGKSQILISELLTLKIYSKKRKGTSFSRRPCTSKGYPSAGNSFTRSGQRLLPTVYLYDTEQRTQIYLL